MSDEQLRAIWRTNATTLAVELIAATVVRLVFGHKLDAAVLISGAVVLAAAVPDVYYCLRGTKPALWLASSAAVVAAIALWFWIVAAFIPALAFVAAAGWALTLFLTFCAARAAQEQGGQWHSLAYFGAALPAVGNVVALGLAFCEHLEKRRSLWRSPGSVATRVA